MTSYRARDRAVCFPGARPVAGVEPASAGCLARCTSRQRRPLQAAGVNDVTTTCMCTCTYAIHVHVTEADAPPKVARENFVHLD